MPVLTIKVPKLNCNCLAVYTMRAQQPKSRGWDTDTLGLVYRTSLKPYGFGLSLGRSAPLKVHQFIFFYFFLLFVEV